MLGTIHNSKTDLMTENARPFNSSIEADGYRYQWYEKWYSVIASIRHMRA